MTITAVSGQQLRNGLIPCSITKPLDHYLQAAQCSKDQTGAEAFAAYASVSRTLIQSGNHLI